jgi:hypothetical protein
MGDIKLSTPRIRVIRDEGSEAVEFQTTNADMVLWDRTRAKHKWPTFQDAPFLWLTFLSWAAARRTGAIPTDFHYERWEAETLDVEALTDDDEADAIPTLPGPEPG